MAYALADTMRKLLHSLVDNLGDEEGKAVVRCLEEVQQMYAHGKEHTFEPSCRSALVSVVADAMEQESLCADGLLVWLLEVVAVVARDAGVDHVTLTMLGLEALGKGYHLSTEEVFGEAPEGKGVANLNVN